MVVQRAHEAAEAKRLEVESCQREEKRIRAEMEEKEKEEALALLAEQEKKKGKKISIKLEEGQTLDKRILMETGDQRTNFRASTDGEEIVEGCQNHGSLRKS